MAPNISNVPEDIGTPPFFVFPGPSASAISTSGSSSMIHLEDVRHNSGGASTEVSNSEKSPAGANAVTPISDDQYLLLSPLGSSYGLPTSIHGDQSVSVPRLTLPADIASADLSVSLDGTFVETSSGEAARELKRRYDRYMGVGKDVRSPYAITAFVNQHGQQRFRVGYRELSAPAASAERAQDPTGVSGSSGVSLQHVPHSPRHPRRSRMSVHSFLPSSVIKSSVPLPPVIPPLFPPLEGSRSPPVRKLRKTRSIPNLSGAAESSASSSRPRESISGRPHAHSVSSADVFQPPIISTGGALQSPTTDVLAEVLGWDRSPLGSRAASFSTRSLHLPVERRSSDVAIGETSRLIPHPFGPGVTFEAPSWNPSPHLSAPPVLREMSSFESILTARADHGRDTKPQGIDPAQHSPIESNTSSSTEDAMREPNRETILHTKIWPYSRYPTNVFDVLQTYRGIPSLDRISPDSTLNTVKLSIKADDSATPRDDPRFVIWGEIEQDEPDFTSSSAGLPSVRNRGPRKRTGKDKLMSISAHPDITTTPASKDPRRMMVAATIERWIAQLTSELDYDELLVFFLTYRTYVSPIDLGHLLICRFMWAVEESTSPHDEKVRRIVRVRTFTAIRYWILTFFAVDFVPNRDLRLLFADWLNNVKRDPSVQRYNDVLRIVRQLRRVILDCKDAYFQREKSDINGPSLNNALRTTVSVDGTQLPRPSESSSREECDIDLDFGDEALYTSQSTSQGLQPSKDAAVDIAILRQPLRPGLQRQSQVVSTHTSPYGTNFATSPVTHNAFSRAIVNTIGRLGRWKRVLHTRTPTRMSLSPYLDISAFDVEASETGDLLLVRGGVEQYLKWVESQMSPLAGSISPTSSPPKLPALPPLHFETPAIPEEPRQTPSDGDTPEPQVEPHEAPAEHEPPVEEAIKAAIHNPISTVPSYADDEDTSSRKETLRSQYESSSPGTPYLRTPGRRLDIVSIDDLDLSDLSSDDDLVSPMQGNLKRSQRRLPTRRDFEFIQRSLDDVTRDSIMSGDTSSVLSSSSAAPELGGPIQQWQVTALVDSLSDEEEAGDAEAALRRLEGQINQDRQRAKESKVNQWVQSIQRRKHGHFENPPGSESPDEDYGEVESTTITEPLNGLGSHDGDHPRTSSSRSSIQSSDESAKTPAVPFATTPFDSSHAEHAELQTGNVVKDAKPILEDAVPLEIIQSRVSMDVPADFAPTHAPGQTSFSFSPSNRSAHPETLRSHRSFILGYSAETLVQHLSMIDKELFCAINFEDMLSSQVLAPTEFVDILDWAQFLRDRARLKVEGRLGYKSNSLTLVRGRFNLMAKFVYSEIVLTHPSQRSAVMNKFIRMAFKAYTMKNYHTLVAIVAGLNSEWVKRAMQQSSHKLGSWGSRVLQDFTEWTTKEADFKHLRQTVEALIEAKPPAPDEGALKSPDNQPSGLRSRAASDSKPPLTCIPFFGVYLSQLHRFSRLPDLVDPTAPNEPVGIDPITNIFEPPAHPEVFSALATLPPSMQLEPLININKQRLIAGVVKSLVAGQHLAARVQYPLDKKLYQKCLKLRGLDNDTLERALALYSK
ncbi:ras GEF [Obba rivulosa]|uniref:Ras GEF n=1 Tax=Obba rivulosa TaxID=1052685 RepID=A0A8E2ATT8_9APHY|nr:ras GEF [Obba rivulosa]